VAGVWEEVGEDSLGLAFWKLLVGSEAIIQGVWVGVIIR